MERWKTLSHCKFLLQYHLILVCKYRKKLFLSEKINKRIKELSVEISSRHGVFIKYMETDKDHIHYMIETAPDTRLSDFIRILKSYTTYHIWQEYAKILIKEFWKERTFWSDSFFVCSAGNVSEQTLKKYIEEQG